MNKYMEKGCDKAYKILKQFFEVHKYMTNVLKGRDGKIIMESKEKYGKNT